MSAEAQILKIRLLGCVGGTFLSGLIAFKLPKTLSNSYNLGKKLTKHLKQTREKLQIPLPPGQCWLNTVIYWCQAICR